MGFRNKQEKFKNNFSFHFSLQDFDTTNNISLFFADPTPFLKALVQCVTTFVQENTGTCGVAVDILGTMFKVCLKLCNLEPSDMPENADFKLDAVNKLFLIRVMVGLVILYDHVNDPNGAFAKGKLTPLKNQGVDRLCIRLCK